MKLETWLDPTEKSCQTVFVGVTISGVPIVEEVLSGEIDNAVIRLCV